MIDISKMSENQVADHMLKLKRQKRWREFFQTGYDWVMLDPEGTVTHPDFLENKLHAIEKCINYYASREEFEKCGDLTKVRGKLESLLNK